MPAYDYVIVGAGSAGCVLAARLTEDPACRVLLLEAGPRDNSWKIDMPSGMGQLLSSTQFNWSYEAEPEPFLDNRRLTHPRGRVLGGSSSINGMVYIRGHARDYDSWSQAGARGWSYADVLPYFKRAEGREGGGDDYRGDDGPLHVARPDLSRQPLANAFIQAGIEAGYPYTPDVNGRQQEGFGAIDRTTRAGKRWSAARAYLHPAMARPNLTVVTGALALGIRLEGRRACGVDYAVNGRAEYAAAALEVIVSGGAINSPQLLQLSGIGAPDHLASLGLTVKHALPGVGENLNDHPDIVIQHLCKQKVTLYPVTRGPRKILTGMRWFLDQKGPAATNHFEAGAFIRSRAGIEHPDLQLTFMPLAVIPGSVDNVPDHAFQVHIDLMRPKSLGYVKARSADPRQPPAIRFNYLKDPQDRADLRASVHLTREILSQKAMQPFAGDEIFPGIDVRTDDEIDAFVRRAIETCYHPVGTCKMGRAEDRLSVVDDQLRVHGLEGLRVVDASIMPIIVSGNTNAPTIMIAEKAADMIRGRAPLPALNLPVGTPENWERAQR
ncbi:choline dehydrogenase [Dongia mobilis]|uniref:Choline dehydrogenase n=1 Tax=Dongia mobilis TaxID=578943 RepID=A0A4R6WVK8_9PROT|nr:choline dehydrogenase [Dongia mobilis]TDQ83356.1 choline dehydrogenase [Dongia mobilis]